VKLSTKGRYGLRLMIDIAIRYNQGPVLLRDIAFRQGISEKYLWQLISPLMTAGLIVSKRGSRGGYELAKEPREIPVYDIVVVLEGDMTLVDCVSEHSRCERAEVCVANQLWTEIANKITHTLKSYTLEDMVKRYREKTGAFAYQI